MGGASQTSEMQEGIQLQNCDEAHDFSLGPPAFTELPRGMVLKELARKETRTSPKIISFPSTLHQRGNKFYKHLTFL